MSDLAGETVPTWLVEHVNQYVSCSCHDGYTDRGLVAPDCQYHDFMEALAGLGIRAVARVQDQGVVMGAEWIDDEGEVIRRDNPHRLADYSVLYAMTTSRGPNP